MTDVTDLPDMWPGRDRAEGQQLTVIDFRLFLQTLHSHTGVLSQLLQIEQHGELVKVVYIAVLAFDQCRFKSRFEVSLDAVVLDTFHGCRR